MATPQSIRQFKAFVQCPSLLQLATAPVPYFTFSWHEDDKVPATVETPKNIVFGRKMEYFFSQALQHSARYEVLAENIQIIEDKVTLGELDFLLLDTSSQRMVHVELACKFYLYLPQRAGKNDWSAWVGPNKNDFLDRKIEKLKNQQLPLLHHRACQKWLALQFGVADSAEITQAVHFPAHLYLPYGQSVATPLINPRAIQGYWISLNDFTILSLGKSQFYLPAKENWLTTPTPDTPWLSYEEAVEAIAQQHLQKKSPLVWIKLPEKTLRMFVVWW